MSEVKPKVISLFRHPDTNEIDFAIGRGAENPGDFIKNVRPIQFIEKQAYDKCIESMKNVVDSIWSSKSLNELKQTLKELGELDG